MKEEETEKKLAEYNPFPSLSLSYLPTTLKKEETEKKLAEYNESTNPSNCQILARARYEKFISKPGNKERAKACRWKKYLNNKVEVLINKSNVNLREEFILTKKKLVDSLKDLEHQNYDLAYVMIDWTRFYSHSINFYQISDYGKIVEYLFYYYFIHEKPLGHKLPIQTYSCGCKNLGTPFNFETAFSEQKMNIMQNICDILDGHANYACRLFSFIFAANQLTEENYEDVSKFYEMYENRASAVVDTGAAVATATPNPSTLKKRFF